MLLETIHTCTLEKFAFVNPDEHKVDNPVSPNLLLNDFIRCEFGQNVSRFDLVEIRTRRVWQHLMRQIQIQASFEHKFLCDACPMATNCSKNGQQNICVFLWWGKQDVETSYQFFTPEFWSLFQARFNVGSVIVAAARLLDMVRSKTLRPNLDQRRLVVLREASKDLRLSGSWI